MGSKPLSQIAQRGVDVVNKPQDLDLAEVSKAQNIEVRMQEGAGGVEPRRGFARLNASALNAGPLSRLFDVDLDCPADKTPYLYAALASDVAGHQWRYSADGITWAYDPIVSARIGSKFSGVSPFKNIPKVVSVGAAIFYADNQTPINIHRYDGVTDTIVGTIPPLVYGALLATPSINGVTYHAVANGATTYTYKIVARNGGSNSAASAAVSFTTSVVTLDSTHYIAITPTSPPISGSTTYDVYRTAGGATQGKIGTITITAGAFTTGNGSGLSGDLLAQPAAPSVALVVGGGYPSGQTYYIKYRIVAKNSATAANSASSADSTPILHDGSVSHHFDLSWTGDSAADGYDVYDMLSASGSFVDAPDFGSWRKFTTGVTTGGSTGTITYTDSANTRSVVAPPTVPTNFAPGPAWVFTDGGLVGDASVAPASAAGTVTATEAVGVFDILTDGANLYLAIYDAAEQTVGSGALGRLMIFSPPQQSWLQIGLAFPLTAAVTPRTDWPKGTPGAILLYLGSIVFGIYSENDTVAAVKSPAITSAEYPLPIGLELQSFSRSVCSMVNLNGDLYAGMAHLLRNGANFSSIIAKRATKDGTWTTDLDAAVNNNSGFTSLAVHGGKIIAGWWSGNGAAVATLKSSAGDGVWTLEQNLGLHEVPGQMVVFTDGNLYLVVGDAGQATPTTRVMKRTPSGVWSEVDPNSANYVFAGAIGIVYR